ncbi:MAG TPA: DUF262 domain-containing protein [Tepidisphaeraceae bacterium]|nr:DUF262 domain-containing protein [Tepidisphaeraceae bacterium]
MDARAKSVREILHSGDQYLIPFFQRSYSWDKEQWKRLADDLDVLLDDDSRVQHFLGPLVCTPSQHVPGEVNAYQLIDGQQRLTTLTLLLTALRDSALDKQDKDFAAEIEEDLLVHKRKLGLQRYKIVPRVGDRTVYSNLMDRKEFEQRPLSSLLKAHSYFRKWIDKKDSNESNAIKRIFAAVADRLSLVVITIAGENPYEIFESLNSTGLPLQESDLIRNYIFMQVPLDQQDAFNVEHWGPFETLLQEKHADASIDATSFYRDYLMRQGKYSKRRSTFVDFKEQNRARGLTPVDQVKELRRLLKLFRLIEGIDRAELRDVDQALSDLRQLEVSTANPVLLALLERWQSGMLDAANLAECLVDLSSFVLRRSVCNLSTRGYGQWFPDSITHFGDNPCEGLKKYFADRGWPSDRAFTASLMGFELYRREAKKTRLILDRLEALYGHKEKVDPRGLTIEHILSQNPDNSAISEFEQVLGGVGNWYPIHQKWIHTLGNLTLTGYNRELSNRSYTLKRPALLESNLVLNKYFENIEQWGPAEIESRTIKLAKEITTCWPNPFPSPEGEEEVLPRWRGTRFDIDGLRQASVANLAQHLHTKLENEAYARFIGKNLRLVCLAARPRSDGKITRYWFGILPGQVEFLKRPGSQYVALSCGSPERLLLFTLAEFEPLIQQMNFTDRTDWEADKDPSLPHERHWHIKVSWGDQILLDQPRSGTQLDITSHLCKVS